VNINREPEIRVGLISGATEARFALSGRFDSDGRTVVEGDHVAYAEGGAVKPRRPGFRAKDHALSLRFQLVSIHGTRRQDRH
jgi:hypothetical protein